MDVFSLSATISLNIDNFTTNLDKAQKKFKSFSDNISDLSGKIESVYKGVGDVLKPAADGFKAVEGVGKQAGNAVMGGLKGFAAASTAVAGFGTAAVKSGMSFDSSMSKVQAISGATGDELQSLRDKALEMGAKSKFSASEAADALTYMGMAGWKTKDMLGGIEGIMNLAAASGEDLASTSDIVTNALTAFGMSASESSAFANILAAASSNANTDVHMMGESFKYAAPVMGTLGYTAADTALALGLMGNNGIQASMAGTSLKTAMLNMASPTKAMAGVMDQYGISLTDANGEMYSLGEIMIQLREKMGGLDETTKAAAASTLFGKEAAAGMMAIINAAPEDFEKLDNSIMACNAAFVKTTDGAIIPMTQAIKEGKEWIEVYEGAAARMAATMEDNLQGDITKVKSAFESLQIAISDSLTPTLREFAQFGQKAMAKLLEGFQGGGVSGFMSALSGIVTQGVTMLAQKAPEFAKVSLQFVTALADGILGAKDSIGDSLFETIYTITQGFGSWLSQNATTLAAFGLDIVTTIFEGFRDAGRVISQNIGEFVPLIAAAFFQYHSALFEIGIDILGGIGRGIVEHKDEIAKWANFAITNMAISLRENAPAIIEGGLALLEALVGAIEENLPLILATGGEIVARLIAGISTASPGVQAIIGTAILPHILKIVDVVGQIGGAFSSVVNLVTGGSGIGKILSIGGKLMGGITKLFGLIAANPVVAIITGIIATVVLLYNKCEWFRDAVHTVIDAVTGFFEEAWEAIKSAWSAAGEFFGGIVDGIKAVFEGIGEFLSGLFSAAWEGIKAVWGAAVEFFIGIWTGIQSAFAGVVEFFGGLFTSALEGIKAVWGTVIEFFSGLWSGIQSIFSGAAEILGGFFTNALDGIKTAWNGVKEFFGDLWSNIKEKASDAASWIGDKLKGAWDGIKSAWDGAKGFFNDTFGGIMDKGREAAENIGNKIVSAYDYIKEHWDEATPYFDGVWGNIKNIFGDAWDKFKEIGGNMLSGLWEGVKSAFGWVKDRLGETVDNIINVFTGSDGFDTHSPSRVFAKIGENLMRGLEGGAKDNVDLVKAQMAATVDVMKGAFSNISTIFTNIGHNAMNALTSSLGGAINSLSAKVANLMNKITSAAKKALKIKSPSKVWAEIGEFMALGLEQGWDNEYGGVKNAIESGLKFNVAPIGVTASNAAYRGENQTQGGFMGGNSYSFTFNSPEALDPVAASRKAKRAAQMMALGYV